GGADYHFSTNTHPLSSLGSSRREQALISSGFPDAPQGQFAGFAFTPALDRQLWVFTDSGSYHPSPEWSENIPHPIEQSRGQIGSGDAFSPGWFDLPLARGGQVRLVVTAEVSDPAFGGVRPSPGAATSEPQDASEGS